MTPKPAAIRHHQAVTLPLEWVRRVAPRRLAAAAYVFAHLGAVFIGLWVVGDTSNEPYDSPDAGSMLGLRLPAPLYGDGLGTVVTGIIGAVLVAASIMLAGAVTRQLGGNGAAWLWASVVWPGLVGFAVGAALRVVFALTWDANIGGGLLLMFGLPVLAFAWVAGVVPLSLAVREEGRAPPQLSTSGSVRSQVLTILLWAVAVAMVMAAPFNVSTLADGIYWTVCSDPQCGDPVEAASVSQIVIGGLGVVLAVVAVTGAALWQMHTRRSRSSSIGIPDPGM